MRRRRPSRKAHRRQLRWDRGPTPYAPPPTPHPLHNARSPPPGGSGHLRRRQSRRCRHRRCRRRGRLPPPHGGGGAMRLPLHPRYSLSALPARWSSTQSLAAARWLRGAFPVTGVFPTRMKRLWRWPRMGQHMAGAPAHGSADALRWLAEQTVSVQAPSRWVHLHRGRAFTEGAPSRWVRPPGGCALPVDAPSRRRPRPDGGLVLVGASSRWVRPPGGSLLPAGVSPPGGPSSFHRGRPPERSGSANTLE